MNSAKDALLKFLRAIDFTSIIKSILSTIGGPFGWLISLVGGGIVSGVEKTVDASIDQTIKTDESDAAIDAAKAQKITQMEQAKTDAQFDEAARNSQH